MVKKINKAFLIILIFSSGFLFTQCTGESDNALDKINTSGINVTIILDRFEQDLFSAKTPQEIVALEKKYPAFYPVYMYQIMGAYTRPNEIPLVAAANLMRNFSAIPDFGIWLKQRADSVYPNLESFKEKLTEAMKRYKYYFPNDAIPEFVTFISVLQHNFIQIDSSNKIGIGTHMYLGNDFIPYHSVDLADNFPNYRIRKMRKDYLLKDLIRAICEAKQPELVNNSRLIDEMIYQGKMLYLIDALIPETPDSIKLGYTPKELNWATENESEIWAAMVDSKIIYSTVPTKNRAFIDDGPFTTAPGFGAGTAPHIGTFTGWQIVKKYMLKNPKVTLAQLLALTDADEILNKSKYKP